MTKRREGNGPYQVEVLHVFNYPYTPEYKSIRVFEDRDWRGAFFRFGLSMGISGLEFLGQIASFERRLRGAAPSSLALPYPFRTWPGTGMGADRDKREVRKILYFEQYSGAILRILMYGEVDKIKLGKTYYCQVGVTFCPKTKVFTFKRKHGVEVGIIVVHLFIELR